MNKTKITISGILIFVLIALISLAIVCFFYIEIIWPLILTAIILAISELIIILRIIASNRSAYAKVCWIFLIVILPIIGLIVFLIFGVNPLIKRQRQQYLDTQKAFLATEENSVNQEVLKKHEYGWLFTYGYRNMLKPVTKDNDIKVIDDNTQLFKESINLIRSAKEFVNVQSFIFKYDGFWTKLFFAELIKKANEGIKIRIIYDWLGSWHRVKPKIFKQLQKYGVEVSCFNPKGLTAFKGATNYRLHSKFIIVDNKTALYGGSNFADEYLSMSKRENHWKDLNFLITGPIVNSMNVTFINYWLTFSKNNYFKSSKQNIRNDTKLLLKKQNFNPSDTLAQLLIFDPNFNDFTLDNTLINCFYNAKKSIKIISPYFCPTPKIIESLIYCHNHNIDVQIITHSKNQKYVQIINRDNLKKVVDLGIKAYEYDGYLHSKLIIIDDEYVLTGSCNLDYRSIYLDFESELIIYDKNFANKMIKYFDKTIKNCNLLTIKSLNDKFNFSKKFVLKLLNIGKSLF